MTALRLARGCRSGAVKLPLSYPAIRSKSKFGPARICSQERELVCLRAEVARLRAKLTPVVPTPAPSTPEYQTAKDKFLAEAAAAKIKHATLMEREAIEAPERARKLAEWRAEQKAIERTKRTSPEGREQQRDKMRRWRAADPERAKAAQRRGYAQRKESPERVKKAKETTTRWRQAHHEKVVANARKWNLANPEKVKATDKRRRLKRKLRRESQCEA